MKRKVLSTAHKLGARILCSFIALLASLALLPGCTPQETPKKVSLYKRAGNTVEQAEQPQPTTLWFGFDLRLGPREEVSTYTPFLKYLENTTGKRFRIKFTEKREDAVANLGQGAIQFAYLGSLNFVRGQKQYGIRYLVSGLDREGHPRSRAMIFTRLESPLKGLADLRGRCFIFGEETSAEGHLIPVTMLNSAGITSADLGSSLFRDAPADVLKTVLSGECDAGSISSRLAEPLLAEGTIKVLAASEPFPVSVVAYHPSVDSKIIDSVKSALLAFDPRGEDGDMFPEWEQTGMPMGFSAIDTREFSALSALVRGQGLTAK